MADLEVFRCYLVLNPVCIYMENCTCLLWSTVFLLPHRPQKVMSSALTCLLLQRLPGAQSISAFLTVAVSSGEASQDLQCESFRAQRVSLAT